MDFIASGLLGRLERVKCKWVYEYSPFHFHYTRVSKKVAQGPPEGKIDGFVESVYALPNNDLTSNLKDSLCRVNLESLRHEFYAGGDMVARLLMVILRPTYLETYSARFINEIFSKFYSSRVLMMRVRFT